MYANSVPISDGLVPSGLLRALFSLCPLGRVGVQAVHGLDHIPLVYDVVPLKNRLCFVATDGFTPPPAIAANWMLREP